ncbi:Uncharacterised protein [Vibrio cholerae]|nr:Uncharacterised protein [Vibrio cholerae]
MGRSLLFLIFVITQYVDQYATEHHSGQLNKTPTCPKVE